MKPALVFSIETRLSIARFAPANKMRRTAMTTLTAGPAMATRNSSLGFSGMRSSRDKPPIGSKITSGVETPKARAVKMCPNSCSSTHRNSSTTNTSAPQAAGRPPEK